MALQVVFSYLPQHDQIQMQQLSKRFYNKFTPALVKHGQLYNIGNVACGVMVFSQQEAHVNILDFNQSYKW